MKLKGIIFEDFINYKKPSMVLEFPVCSWKCNKEYGGQVCQNSALATSDDITVDIQTLVKRYIQNPITCAIVCAGLEPFDSFLELYEFISAIRKKSNDDIVIYTGYNIEEINHYIELLKKYQNIIVKFGRFIPNDTTYYCDVLGVYLASSNQYAMKIS